MVLLSEHKHQPCSLRSELEICPCHQPLHITFSFTDAARGLLKVNPKQLKQRTAKTKAAKKATRKKG